MQYLSQAKFKKIFTAASVVSEKHEFHVSVSVICTSYCIFKYVDARCSRASRSLSEHKTLLFISPVRKGTILRGTEEDRLENWVIWCPAVLWDLRRVIKKPVAESGQEPRFHTLPPPLAHQGQFRFPDYNGVLPCKSMVHQFKVINWNINHMCLWVKKVLVNTRLWPVAQVMFFLSCSQQDSLSLLHF